MNVPALVFRHRSALLALLTIPLVCWALVAGPALASEAPALAAGAALVVFGAALRVWAARVIGKRARVRRAGAKVLAADGPYGRLRNPLYVANGAILVGLAALAGGGWWTLAVLAGVAAVYSVVVHHEEGQLRQILGAPYLEYCAHVPRWLPRPGRKVPAELRGSEPWPWSDVLVREKNMLLLPVGAALVLWVRAGLLQPVDGWLAGRGLPALVVLAPVAIVVGTILNGVKEEVKLRRHAEARAAAQGAAPDPDAGRPAGEPASSAGPT
jgi:protein-S-isoprenylcysteine O-methyltransferase Ste14